jgi:hypothetical protein
MASFQKVTSRNDLEEYDLITVPNPTLSVLVAHENHG